MNIFFWLVLVVVVGEMEMRIPLNQWTSAHLSLSFILFPSLLYFDLQLQLKLAIIPYPLRSSFLFLYADGADSFFLSY